MLESMHPYCSLSDLWESCNDSMEPEYDLESIENVVNGSSFSLRFNTTPPRHIHMDALNPPNNTVPNTDATSVESTSRQNETSSVKAGRASLDGRSNGSNYRGPLRDKVVGYPRLAAHIERNSHSAIYHRFTALNAQNVLYLQAELTELEMRLQRQQVVDHHSTKGHKGHYAVNWCWLESSADDGDTNQLDLVLRIREVLNVYNQALIQQATILNYPDPHIEDVHFLQNLLQSPAMGEPALQGRAGTIWGSVDKRKGAQPDLVTSRPRPRKDKVTIWATKQAAYLILRIRYGISGALSRTHGAIGYDEHFETVYRIIYMFMVIIASLIPIASIAILYYVRSMEARLAIIAAFDVLVSVCLMSLAEARWVEVFAITAAFAAVQVVFVATDRN